MTSNHRIGISMASSIWPAFGFLCCNLRGMEERRISDKQHAGTGDDSQPAYTHTTNNKLQSPAWPLPIALCVATGPNTRKNLALPKACTRPRVHALGRPPAPLREHPPSVKRLALREAPSP